LFSCQSVNAQANSGKIVFADEFGRLLLINADGTGQTILTEALNIRDGNPVYSPDGSKIAFDRTILGKTSYLHNERGWNKPSQSYFRWTTAECEFS
jgi:Tol biopolymer transport system component